MTKMRILSKKVQMQGKRNNGCGTVDSGVFQRSRVQIQSSVTFIEQLFTVNYFCITDENKEKRAEMPH